MTRFRIALVAGVVCLAVGGVMIPTAVAAGTNGSAGATSVPPIYKLHVTGMSKNGNKKFTGTYAIQRYIVTRVHGKRGVYAIGTVTGRFEGRRITRNNVLAPASLQGGSVTHASRSVRATTSCTILHLVLGPLHLDLLGLVIDLNQVVLDITAVSGAGNLLGNLLCAITGLLDGTSLANLTALLNGLLALLG
jgi:hypothetical protein